MADEVVSSTSPEAGSSSAAPDRELIPARRAVEEEDIASYATHDVHGASVKIQRAREAYKAYAGVEEKPKKVEVLSWYFYELCSHFVLTVLVPIVFPLILSQIIKLPESWDALSAKSGATCTHKEINLYLRLTKRTILSRYSPLEWTSISWGIGLAVASPFLAFVPIILDHGYNQPIIAVASIAMGSIFCLPAGSFKNIWIFPPYIAAIVASSLIATACHTRHLGLMVRGFTGPTLHKSQFPSRRAVNSWLSLYAAAAGSLGSAVISSFTYRMLKEKEEILSLWIVSIFSGIKWLCGIFHFLVTNRPCTSTPVSSSSLHVLSVFKFPHALGTLAGIFVSSLTTMCLFTGGVLYLVGELCYKPKSLLFFWLTYFISPLISLPLLHPLQQVIKGDAVKMQLLGFFLSAATSGFGFYFRGSPWQQHHVLFFAVLQSTSTGVLHAYGRALLMDCSPSGKEGAFSTWFSWMRGLGMCVGFAIASSFPGNVRASFGMSFCTTICGMVILIFGNISDFGGAKAAGHVRGDKYDHQASPVAGVDTAYDIQEPMQGP
ncbi:PREDICTED: uncharacterized protein LOC101309451 [Fragaria vesca subsp. vesca]